MKQLQAFACRCKGDPHETTINTTSAGKAKSEYFTRLLDCSPDYKFTDIRIRRLGSPVSSDGFRRNAIYRGIPFAYVGMRVKVGEDSGRIVGHNSSANLNVLFDDGRHKGLVLNCHPNWMMTYFDADGGEIR